MAKNIPSPPRNLDRQLLTTLQKMTELLEQGEGVRGDILQANVKWQHLLDVGMLEIVGSLGNRLLPGQNLLPTAPVPNLSIPSAPTGFVVTDGFSAVYLYWDNPLDLYSNHAYTEVWRGTENNLANATLIGQVHTSFIFGDFGVEQGTTYYYWIRFVSEGGVTGPYNSSNGLPGSRSLDPAEIMAVISGEINESDLAIDLQTKINTEGDGAYVEQNQEAIDGLIARWSVKTQVGDLVGGVGFYNNGSTTQFLVNASTFAVLGQGSNSVAPFIVQNGAVYMDTVLIRDGSLSSAKIGSLSVDKLVGNIANFIQINTANGSITNAKIGNTIQSNSFFIGGNGQSRGWQLNKDSGIRAVDITIYDYNGSVVLQGGGGLTAHGLNAALPGSTDVVSRHNPLGSANIDVFMRNAAIDTLYLGGRALVFPETSNNTNLIDTINGTYVYANDINYRGEPAPLLVMYSVRVNNPSASDDRVDIALYRRVSTGSFVTISTHIDLNSSSDRKSNIYTFIHFDQPNHANGQNVNYRLEVRTNDNNINILYSTMTTLKSMSQG